MNCCYCEKSDDLRPYGPHGAMVCFDCAMSTPERRAATENNFAQQLDASGEFALLDGTETGPYPAKHHPVVNMLLPSNTRLDDTAAAIDAARAAKAGDQHG